MARAIRVAAISVSTFDGMVSDNYARALRLGEVSLRENPDIVLFPEAFAAGYCCADLTPYRETIGSEHISQFQQLSKNGNCLVVVGFLETADRGLRNAAALFEKGEHIGTHYKSTLWPDDERPHRDERRLMIPGEGIEVFQTSLGKCSVLICYENMIEENWDAAREADFILSPYNCEGDPSKYSLAGSKRIGKPSAWADRTGTVYCGEGELPTTGTEGVVGGNGKIVGSLTRASGYMPNLGTAGMVDAKGEMIASSTPGVEDIVVSNITI